MLEESVEDWWILYATRAGGVYFVTWEGFQRGFQEKFHPCSFVDERRKEFLSLVQGDKTVPYYKKKFIQLVKYTIAFILV